MIGMSEGGPVAPDGVTQVAVDIPVELRQHNRNGRDGSGCCTYAALQISSRYQNDRRLWHILNDVASHERGGGWPDKMAAMVAKYGHGAKIVQYEGNDPAMVMLALKTGRVPCTSYNGNDVHYPYRISHMLNTVYLDSKVACILDNNCIGAKQLVWMTHSQWMQRYAGSSNGWTVVLLTPRPPAPTKN